MNDVSPNNSETPMVTAETLLTAVYNAMVMELSLLTLVSVNVIISPPLTLCVTLNVNSECLKFT